MRRSPNSGSLPDMNALDPSKHGPRFEMASVGRYLEDLTPAEAEVPRVGRTEALIWSACVLIALIAFIGWLLIG
jgi:hypothetical protein